MAHIDYIKLDLVKRYKSNYSISEKSIVTREMVMQHWELERKLTNELLISTTDNRWEIFEKCYTTLYKELNWLNQMVHEGIDVPPSERYRAWMDAIGSMPKRIYEIGSGKGSMITYLSSQGHSCKATEITRERGGKFLVDNVNVELGNTDGIHLDNFEMANSYDVLLSDQVIEHLHPDDIITHFKSAFSILKSGGRYIFATPHLYLGPHDVSKVFGCTKAMGMHLKEYTFKELALIAKEAGFQKISYAYKFTKEMEAFRISLILSKLGIQQELQKKVAGSIYYKVVRLSEKFVSILPGMRFKKAVAKLLAKPKLLSGNIFLELHKL